MLGCSDDDAAHLLGEVPQLGQDMARGCRFCRDLVLALAEGFVRGCGRWRILL